MPAPGGRSRYDLSADSTFRARPGGGIIAGRSAGVHLSDAGRSQAAELAERVAHLPIAAIYSSPMERTRETARFVADKLGLQVQAGEALSEIDFGDWTRRRIEDLRADPLWDRFNQFRSGTRIPGGELMLEPSFASFARWIACAACTASNASPCSATAT